MVNIKKSYMKIKHRDIFTKEQIEEFVGEFVTINYKGLLDRKVLVTRLFKGSIGFDSKEEWILGVIEIGKGFFEIPIAISNILEIKKLVVD
jgi:hypothetical protein